MSSQSWPTVTPVHLPPTISEAQKSISYSTNPLPPLLQTPSGLAIIELQGTINFPSQPDSSSTEAFEVGRLVFPQYTPGISDPNSGAWMKRVYFYVGKHQRMTGEIKKLVKPLAVLRKVRQANGGEGSGGGAPNEVEIAEVVRYKIIFGSRPEPVGGDMG